MDRMNYGIYGLFVLMSCMGRLLAQEPYDHIDIQVPISFSAPFPITPFENAHKYCVKIFERVKELAAAESQSIAAQDKIIDQFLKLYYSIEFMKKAHPARKLRCDDVEYLVNILSSVESILMHAHTMRSEVLTNCALVLCKKNKQLLLELLKRGDASGCIVIF